MSSWLNDAQIASLSDVYAMGQIWEGLAAPERLKVVTMVSHRWEALPWNVGEEPEQPESGSTDTRWDSMDDGLKVAFAQHCRYLADANLNPDINPEEGSNENERLVLSDVPRFTRNILLGRYVNVDGEFPWSAEQIPTTASSLFEPAPIIYRLSLIHI